MGRTQNKILCVSNPPSTKVAIAQLPRLSQWGPPCGDLRVFSSFSGVADLPASALGWPTCFLVLGNPTGGISANRFRISAEFDWK